MSRYSEKKGCIKYKIAAARMLKNDISTNALKMAGFEFLFPADNGKRAFINPFSQKKLSAPEIKINVSYSPISSGESAVFVNTTPIKTRVVYLANW